MRQILPPFMYKEGSSELCTLNLIFFKMESKFATIRIREVLSGTPAPRTEPFPEWSRNFLFLPNEDALEL